MEVLPADIIRVIGGYLPAPYYVVLMGVSKRLRSIFTPLRQANLRCPNLIQQAALDGNIPFLEWCRTVLKLPLRGVPDNAAKGTVSKREKK